MHSVRNLTPTLAAMEQCPHGNAARYRVNTKEMHSSSLQQLEVGGLGCTVQLLSAT